MSKTDIIEKLADGVWAVDDERGCSFYLVEGTEKAALIDTGMALRPVQPLVRELTDKPVELILTHAHTDHMYHENEFDNVYLHKADIQAWRFTLAPAMFFASKAMFKIKHRRCKVKRYNPLNDNSEICLGGVTLKVIKAPGHTPGSVLLKCDERQMLFTGDAFGSGAGAWVWLPGSLKLSAYGAALKELLPRLEACRHYKYLAGHRRQGKPYSKDDNAHELNFDTVKDMSALCTAVLNKTAKPKYEFKYGPLSLYQYEHKSAGFTESKRKIK